MLGALFSSTALAGAALRLPSTGSAPAAPEGEVYGLVTDFDGAPVAGVLVTACGESDRSDERGHVVLDASCGAEPEAVRQDGLLLTGPAYTTSERNERGERVVGFVFDPRPTGGMGLSVVGTREGIRVQEVLAGTPVTAVVQRRGERVSLTLTRQALLSAQARRY